MKRSISIADIALAANVSHSTVSRALRDSPLISAEVRQRVQLLAQELGYVPNAIAQSLKRQRSNTVGLIVTSIADPFFPDVIKGVEETARPVGMGVFISATHSDEALEREVIDTFHRRQVDGVIVVSSRLAPHYQQLGRLGVPAVVVNDEAQASGQALHSVRVDDHGGAMLAVRYLIKLGHRRIGYLGVADRPRSNKQRRSAYVDALLEAGLPVDPALMAIAGGPGPEADDVLAGARQLPQLLAARATAVFCYNDMVAIGALRACRERQVAVPGQLSVVGFDDIALAQHVAPPLTTVTQPRRELGSRAMQKLLRLIQGQPVENDVLAAQLVVRASAAPPPLDPRGEQEERKGGASDDGREL